MSSYLNRNHIDDHWLTFIAKGAIAALFGWIFLFNSGENSHQMLSIAGFFLLTFSVIEFFNALYRARNKYGWLASVLIAMFDSIAAIIILFTLNEAITASFITISAYAFLRGIVEIILGFRILDDSTDRFIWILTGICGTIMGIVIFNSGHLEGSAYIRFFGAYILVLGISNLIYGVHNRAQKRAYIAEKVAKPAKPAKSKKPAKKSSKKSK